MHGSQFVGSLASCSCFFDIPVTSLPLSLLCVWVCFSLSGVLAAYACLSPLVRPFPVLLSFHAWAGQVMKILNLAPGDVVCFKSSFNRTNLRWDICLKIHTFSTCMLVNFRLQFCTTLYQCTAMRKWAGGGRDYCYEFLH